MYRFFSTLVIGALVMGTMVVHASTLTDDNEVVLIDSNTPVEIDLIVESSYFDSLLSDVNPTAPTLDLVETPFADVVTTVILETTETDSITEEAVFDITAADEIVNIESMFNETPVTIVEPTDVIATEIVTPTEEVYYEDLLNNNDLSGEETATLDVNIEPVETTEVPVIVDPIVPVIIETEVSQEEALNPDYLYIVNPLDPEDIDEIDLTAPQDGDGEIDDEINSGFSLFGRGFNEAVLIAREEEPVVFDAAAIVAHQKMISNLPKRSLFAQPKFEFVEKAEHTCTTKDQFVKVTQGQKISVPIEVSAPALENTELTIGDTPAGVNIFFNELGQKTHTPSREEYIEIGVYRDRFSQSGYFTIPIIFTDLKTGASILCPILIYSS